MSSLDSSSGRVALQFPPHLLARFHACRDIGGMAKRPYGGVPANANNRIREIRLREGLTLEEVALRMETTPQTIQRWELEGNLSVKKLNRLAGAMGVKPRELVLGDDGLTDIERTFLDYFRNAPANQRRAIEALAEHGGQEAFEHRPAEAARKKGAR